MHLCNVRQSANDKAKKYKLEMQFCKQVGSDSLSLKLSQFPSVVTKDQNCSIHLREEK